MLCPREWLGIAVLATSAWGLLAGVSSASPPTPAGTGLARAEEALITPLGELTSATALSLPDSPIPEAYGSTPRPTDLRLEQLRRLVLETITAGPLAAADISLLVRSRSAGLSSPASIQSRPANRATLIALNPDEPRVPASNAKLFVSAAAAGLLAGRYRFVTELALDRPGGTLYVWGTGDPLFGEADLRRLARTLRARGFNHVGEIVLDDSHFGDRRLAPGFEQFSARSRFRPSSSALNYAGNLARVRVNRARSRGRRGRRARPSFALRAVPDPTLYLGRALRRALAAEGIRVRGDVARGRRPAEVRVQASVERPLSEILSAVNAFSDNLAAETLVRAIATLPHREGEPATAKSAEWQRGLRRIHDFLRERAGITGVELRNGSGLHRSSTVTARALCALLEHVYYTPELRGLVVPALAIAGRSGTLARRMHHTAAEGHVHAKTGTLRGVLALSGLVLPTSREDGAAHPPAEEPLFFSLLVNGTSRRQARRQMDRIVTLMARYGRGLAPDPSPMLEPLLATPDARELPSETSL